MRFIVVWLTWRPTAVTHIAEFLAETMASRSGEPEKRINEVREYILRDSSKIANQVRLEQVVAPLSAK